MVNMLTNFFRIFAYIKFFATISVSREKIITFELWTAAILFQKWDGDQSIFLEVSLSSTVLAFGIGENINMQISK